MGYVSLTRHLDAPPEDVFRFVTDPARLLTWLTIFEGVDPRAERLDHVGAKFDADLVVGGRHLDSLWEVTKAEPPSVIHLEGWFERNGGATVWLNAGAWDGGTEFEIEVDYDLGGGVTASMADVLVIHRNVARELKRSVQRLAERVGPG